MTKTQIGLVLSLTRIINEPPARTKTTLHATHAHLSGTLACLFVRHALGFLNLLFLVLNKMLDSCAEITVGNAVERFVGHP